MCYVCSVVAMAISAQELVLEVLQALTSNTQIVKETMQKGMYATTTLKPVRSRICLSEKPAHDPATLGFRLTGAEKNCKESVTTTLTPLAMGMILSFVVIVSMRVCEPGNA